MQKSLQPPREDASRRLPSAETSVVLGIRLARLTRRAFIETLVASARSPKPRFVTYLNAHTMNIYFSDAEYARIIDHADIVYADGAAVVWASRFLGDPLPERISAADFFDQFCRRCADEQLSLFFLGSQPGVAERAQKTLQHRVTGLRIVGAHHGHFRRSDDASVCNLIRAAQPAILVVGMGTPRQEKWVAANIERLGLPVCWCVGALFEYVAGVRRHAPSWMRRAGFEWLFRLSQEPGRLWQRYLIGNPRFLIRVIRYKLRPIRNIP